MAPVPLRVHLVSFGPLKTMFSQEGEWRELPAGESVAGLLDLLHREGTLSASARACAAVAVNHEYAQPQTKLTDGDEVAILPPVSGGAGVSVLAASTLTAQPLIALVREPIDAAAVGRRIKAGADGAMCVFDGVVRDNTRGRPTLYLEYEAYEEMALRQMRLLRQEAIDRFQVREVAILHRLGHLVVGETSVLIAVTAAHRGAAFDACRWVIDTLKKTVPIWKREQFTDGAVWADGEPFPERLALERPTGSEQ